MLDGEFWDLSAGGLLNFITDSFYEINSRDTQEECIIEATRKIKELLSSLLKTLKLLETTLDLNLSKFIFLICEALQKMIIKHLPKVGIRFRITYDDNQN